MTEQDTDASHTGLIELTSEVIAAYVAHNSISAADLPKLIADVHAAMASLSAGNANVEPEAPPLVPAVSIRRSITPDYLVCLDDGKKFKALKRHLTQLGMTPDEYRTKWGLPKDYPMVAPNYAATRSQLAKQNGLGRKPIVPVAPAKTTRKRVKA